MTTSAERSTVRQMAGETRRLRKVLAASMAGAVIEWYEFLVYGVAAALVFGQIFFQQTGDPLDGVIAALLTYAVGFAARPLGGVIFGHYGDRYGRKKMLQVSLALAGVSTFLMGLLPTFEQVGYFAPLGLVLLRFCQGLAIGGEWGGAVLLVGENSSPATRGFIASFPQAAAAIGNILATLVMIVLSSVLSESAFLSWGWRIAFLLSAVILVAGWYIRRNVDEPEIFKEAAAELTEADRAPNALASAKDVVKRYPRNILIAMGLRVVENILYYLVATFSLTYLGVYLGLATTQVLSLMLVAHVAHGIALIVCGGLSDRIGRRRMYGIGVVLAGGYAFVAFPLMNTESLPAVVLALVLGLVIHAVMWGPQPALMAEMFPTTVRYMGISIGVQVTAIFAGSLAPLIATSLLKEYDSYLPIAIYVAVAALISFAAVVASKETRGVALESVT
jgi:MFS family permease